MAARPKTRVRLKTVAALQPGRDAITDFLVTQRFARFTILSVRIHTGRTHQIRVHMLAYNHPVVGDTVYYNKKLNRKRDEALGRLFLHAAKLCFDTQAGERVCYESALPQELQKFLSTLN
jgi:23S rRNA pseudouridine1911/1915/1917 synthase